MQQTEENLPLFLESLTQGKLGSGAHRVDGGVGRVEATGFLGDAFLYSVEDGFVRVELARCGSS